LRNIQAKHHDPAYAIKKADVDSFLSVYAKAVKRRDRLTGTHLKAYDRAIE
jgi:hypothetical protein